LDDAKLQTPHEVCLVLNVGPTTSEEGKEIGIESSGLTAETPKAMD